VEIETWKEFQDLFALCNFIVMARPGSQGNLACSLLPQTLSPVFRYDENIHGWIHDSGHTLISEASQAWNLFHQAPGVDCRREIPSGISSPLRWKPISEARSLLPWTLRTAPCCSGQKQGQS